MTSRDFYLTPAEVFERLAAYLEFKGDDFRVDFAAIIADLKVLSVACKMDDVEFLGRFVEVWVGTRLTPQGPNGQGAPD